MASTHVSRINNNKRRNKIINQIKINVGEYISHSNLSKDELQTLNQSYRMFLIVTAKNQNESLPVLEQLKAQFIDNCCLIRKEKDILSVMEYTKDYCEKIYFPKINELMTVIYNDKLNLMQKKLAFTRINKPNPKPRSNKS